MPKRYASLFKKIDSGLQRVGDSFHAYGVVTAVSPYPLAVFYGKMEGRLARRWQVCAWLAAAQRE